MRCCSGITVYTYIAALCVEISSRNKKADEMTPILYVLSDHPTKVRINGKEMIQLKLKTQRGHHAGKKVQHQNTPNCYNAYEGQDDDLFLSITKTCPCNKRRFFEL